MKRKLILATVAATAMLAGGATTAFAATSPANGAQTTSPRPSASVEVTPVTITLKHGRLIVERARGTRGTPVVERARGTRVKPVVVRLRDFKADPTRRGPVVVELLRGKHVVVSRTLPSK